MSKFSNIYDIDGNIIRRADQGPFTIEETEQLVDELTQKVKDNPNNKIYKIYLDNAQMWLFKLYNRMSRKDLMNRLDFIQNSIQEAKNDVTEAEQAELKQINEAIEELKNEYDKESDTTNEAPEEPRGELDRLVEQPMEVTTSAEEL